VGEREGEPGADFSSIDLPSQPSGAHNGFTTPKLSGSSISAANLLRCLSGADFLVHLFLKIEVMLVSLTFWLAALLFQNFLSRLL
jgi:hypothetical protein